MLLLSAAPLAGAYFSQYALGYEPCPLCIYQRIPYWVIVGLSIAAVLLNIGKTSVKPLLILCGFAFLTDAGIAFFHTGVEQSWWEGLDACGASGIVAQTIDELRAQLTGAPVARCDEAPFTLLGLSMAAWNAVYALGCSYACAVLYGKQTSKA